MYGDFAVGCMNSRINYDLRSEIGRSVFRKFIHAAAELAAWHGGSLFGEHGDGRACSEFLPVMYFPEMITAFETYRRLWDEAGILNPGSITEADPVDANLAQEGVPQASGGLTPSSAPLKRQQQGSPLGPRCPILHRRRPVQDWTSAGSCVQATALEGTKGRHGILQVGVLLALLQGQNMPDVALHAGVAASLAEAHHADQPPRQRRHGESSRLCRRRRRRPDNETLYAQVCDPEDALGCSRTERSEQVLIDSFTKGLRPEVAGAAARVIEDRGRHVACQSDVRCGLTWIPHVS
jgi:hypothetical protein